MRITIEGDFLFALKAFAMFMWRHWIDKKYKEGIHFIGLTIHFGEIGEKIFNEDMKQDDC